MLEALPPLLLREPLAGPLVLSGSMPPDPLVELERGWVNGVGASSAARP